MLDRLVFSLFPLVSLPGSVYFWFGVRLQHLFNFYLSYLNSIREAFVN